jgi:hypothetical protein
MNCAADAAGVRSMPVCGRLRIRSLGGATGWLNSEPLGPAELDSVAAFLAPYRDGAYAAQVHGYAASGSEP